MKTKLLKIIITLTLAFAFTVGESLPVFSQTQSPVPVAKTYEFANGNWFDGAKFKRRVFYSANGSLTKKRPSRIDETIDLKNGFVIPPFGDAHTHNFDGAFNLEKIIRDYLTSGVFYAKVQTNTLSGARAAAKSVSIPTSVDVAYSHGGLTASYGHGVEVYEGLALLRKPGANTPEEVQRLRASKLRENDAYYIIDTERDLEMKWQKILDGKPDFLKIYLLTTEEFDARKNRTDTVGDRGLDPQLVPLIVKKARAAGLRVSAHVDTVTDYRVALRAGVSEIAHLPGYYVGLDYDARKVTLTKQDARETARRRIWVVPAPVYNQYLTAAEREKTDGVLRNNLGLLNKARAPIAFGSDRYGSTPVDDVFHIAGLGVFNNLELLKIWSEATPRTIFPARKIGKLRAGYEASFLVLEADPLVDFKAVKNIRWRFKQGFVLEVPNIK